MPAIRSLPAAGWVAAACIGLLLVSHGGGCGRKLAPIQPGVLPPPTVADLTHEVRADEILLFWSLPAFNPAKESAAAGFKVLRARQTAAEAECRTCPPAFQLVADIAAAGRSPGSRMRFRDVLEPGFKHSYKLISYSSDGLAGKASAPVAVAY